MPLIRYMDNRQNKTYLILALATAIGLLFHGASFFSTLEDTYDIYVHLFFADHYAKSWFDPWEYKWYTGFSLVSYPPLVHQLIALLSYLGGIKLGAYLLAFGVVLLYITGAYRFSKIFTINNESAAYAALVAVFCPSVIEALHVFGQLPMGMGISWLLHAIPEIYLWVRWGKNRYFFNAISLLSVAVASHHVTPIFGMVFFVLPVMATAVMDGAKASIGSYAKIGIRTFIIYAFKYIKRIIIFGLSAIAVTILVILPYWIYSKNDPISQVPIPHGSRDSFIEVFSSGLVFFIIPWGFFFLFIPFILYRLHSKRNIFIGISFVLLFVLGTGGTTPIPKMLLGENAFSILTLERFTFWATIIAMPFIAEFLWRFFEGNIYDAVVKKYSKTGFKLLVVVLVGFIFISSGFTMNLSFFRPLQPDPIKLDPITNFLSSDKHDKWRFLTLGFGDQMAKLSAQTNALTIDGNYHSARRVPELTTRAIERLENSKYRGVEGIGTLQQFLTSPELFHLKYVFSNDKFYDPLLYFTGWHRVKLLSNGIMIWERSDVSPLPSTLPKKDISMYQKIHWGIVPLTVLIIAFFFNVQLHWMHHISSKKHKRDSYTNPEEIRDKAPKGLYHIIQFWVVLVIIFGALLLGKLYFQNLKQVSPQRAVASYYDAVDFKKFKIAHSYINPDDSISIGQFLLQSSVTDGLVDSYGKLNNIESEVLKQTDQYAKVKVRLEWVTALENYSREVIHEVIKKGEKWYLKSKPFKNDLPTNQFFNLPTNQFHNQGRRTVSTEETFHEDVLDRPVVQVMQSSLVKKGNKYAVVGLIQNLDDYPSDLTIKATLVDSLGNVITSYYDKFYLTHKLLPKEITAFRVDFESVGWLKTDSTSQIFDPKAFEEIELRSEPVQFKLEILSSVSTQDLYRDLSINESSWENSSFKGSLFNTGIHASTITQLIISYLDKESNIVWVDHHFVPKSVFPRRNQSFEFQSDSLADLTIINTESIETLINGLNTHDIIQKYKSNQVAKGLNTHHNSSTDFQLYININPFIGSIF